MTIRLGVIMDPIAGIHYHKDTTLALLLAAAARGWELFYMEQPDLFIEAGAGHARMRELTVRADPADWFTFGIDAARPLADLDVILMRKDPPVDAAFIYATMVLDFAADAGSLVLNPPQALREHNEKLFATRFPELMSPTLVTASMSRLREFTARQGRVVLKPLDGMGGASIFVVAADDPNASVILETLTRHGKFPVMAQRYLPEISEGDKRILMIEGEPVPWGLARIPKSGESRGNLAAGGTGVGFELTETELAVARKVGPVLRREGILFAGLDIIGSCLTEINITSPTCVQEINRAFSVNIADQVIDAIAARLD